jgi:hypothetical protein
MKILKLISVVALLAVSALAQNAFAQNVYKSTGASGTTLAQVVFSAKPSGTPVVTYVSATSDLSTSKVQFWSAGTAVPVTATSAASGTNIFIVGTSFSANDTIAIRKVDTDLYQVATVNASTATNLLTNMTLTRAVGVGDVVYKLTANGTIPVGAATVSAIGQLASGENGKPLAITLTGTSACVLNNIAVEYKR